MNINTLQKIAQFQGLSQSDLAKAARVSRQAVSQWFMRESDFVPIASDHLLNLSQALGVNADVLLREIEEQDWWEKETTNLLWDKLFTDLIDLLAAGHRGDLRALARSVEVYGLFTSSQIFGDVVWEEFPNYKSYLPPIRRAELEQLWKTQKNLHFKQKPDIHKLKRVLDKLNKR